MKKHTIVFVSSTTMKWYYLLVDISSLGAPANVRISGGLSINSRLTVDG